jgi:hypothetical protein
LFVSETVGDIVQDVNAPTEDKTDDVKGSFYEKLECVFYNFSKYHLKNLLGDFNAKVGRGNISNQQLGMKVYTKLVMK